jgi:hypothetical protein
MNFLKKIAPFLSTALRLAGPWGALAGTALQAATGAKSSSLDDLDLALSKATPEQVAAIRKAEEDFQLQMKQLEIQSLDELEKAADEDRASARQMQVATRSRLPAVISIVITIGFLGLLGGMMLGALKVSENQALLIMLGNLGAGWMAVISYYFGSSAGSARKTELLASVDEKK